MAVSLRIMRAGMVTTWIRLSTPTSVALEALISLVALLGS